MIEIGKTYELPCPFIREVFESQEDGGSYPVMSWRPGVTWECCGPDGGSSQAYAHAMGKVIYRVIDVHKLPRPYPARVFFVRTWVDPNGRSFGKRGLRIMTEEAFARRLNGYRCGGMDEDDEFIVEDLSEETRLQMLRKAA